MVRLNDKQKLLVSYLVIIAAFIFTRITYFLYYPIPAFTKDIFTYNEPVMTLLKGGLPDFGIRTPAYPLFLFFTYKAGLTVEGIFLLQMLSSTLVLMSCCYILIKYLRAYFLPVFIMLLMFYSSGRYIALNTNINPLSFFTDFTILSIFLLAAGIISNKKGYLLLASFVAAEVILLRPQGLFFVPVYAFVAGWFWFTKNSRSVLPLAGPVAIICLLSLTYNKLTFGKFAFSNFGNITYLGTSIHAIEQDSSFPVQLNERIAEVKATIPPGHLKIIEHGFSFSALDTVFTTENYDKCWLFSDIFKKRMDLIERVNRKAYISHPKNYYKQRLFSFLKFYELQGQKTFFYYNELGSRKYFIEETNEYMNLDSAKNYPLLFRNWSERIIEHRVGPYPLLDNPNERTAYFSKENKPVKLLNYYEIVYNMLFSNLVWVALFWVSFFLLLIKWILTKCKDKELLALLLFPSVHIANSLLVAYTIIPLKHYVFATELFLLLTPLLTATRIFNERGKRAKYNNALPE